MIKHFLYIIFTLFLISSCNSKKIVVDNSGKTIKYATAKSIIKAHEATKFDKKTLDAKLGLSFQNNNEDISFSVRMKIIKDKEIWLKGTKLITVFKAKITPSEVLYYSPYRKDYFKGDFSILKKLLGTDISFEQLQNILTGQALFNLNKEKHLLKKEGSDLILYPKNQNNLFSIFYHFSFANMLSKQVLNSTSKNQQLAISYPKYFNFKKTVFPKNIVISAKENLKETIININVKSISFDKNVNTPFSIPQGYKRIEL